MMPDLPSLVLHPATSLLVRAAISLLMLVETPYAEAVDRTAPAATPCAARKDIVRAWSSNTGPSSLLRCAGGGSSPSSGTGSCPAGASSLASTGIANAADRPSEARLAVRPRSLRRRGVGVAPPATSGVPGSPAQGAVCRQMAHAEPLDTRPECGSTSIHAACG